VDDPALVRHANRPSKGLDQAGGRVRRPRVAAEPVGQAATSDPLHREEGASVVEPDLVDLDDVGVLHPRGQLGLAAEPLPLHLGRERAGQDHLQGHGPAQVAMPRLIDDPHPAAPDLAQDDVLSDFTWGRWSWAGGIWRGRARAAEFPTQGAGRPPPLGLPLRDIAPQRRGRPQPAEKPVATKDDVDRRAADLATGQVLGNPVQVVVPECTGGKLAQPRGVGMILGVRNQDTSLPSHTLPRLRMT
jgi:hypothetical protein